jgi:ABC-type enterochelin transport system permease subunit
MRSATLSVTIGEVAPMAFLSLVSARVHSEQVKPLNHEKIMPLCLAVGRARILRIDLAIHQPSYM